MENYLQKELYTLIKKDDSIFHFIKESALDGLWYWDLENRENEWMDNRFWEVLGYNPGEMPHKSNAWQDIIFPGDLKKALKNFEKHIENPEHPYDQVVRYKHKNGSTVWVRCKGKAIRDKNGKPVRMVGAHHNLTEIKKTELLLKQSEERFRAIFEHNKSVMMLIDPDTGEIIDANKAACNFYGFNNLKSKKVYSINQFSDEQVNELMKAARNNERNHFFFRHKLSNKETREVEVYSTPLKYRSKEVLFSIVHDITEQKQANLFSELLSKATLDLFQMDSPREIYRYIIDKLYELTRQKAIITIVEYHNPVQNRWKMMEVRGVNPAIASVLNKFGIDIEQMEGEVHTKFLDVLQKGKLVSLQFDLHQLTNGKYTQKTAKALIKLLPVDDLLIMPFKRGNDIYGNVTIAPLQKKTTINLQLIEAFISQTAIFLEKIFTERELKESERKLLAAEKIAHIGNYEIDLITGKAKWSDETFHIFGMNPQTDQEPTVTEYSQLIHPQDKEMVFEHYNESIKYAKNFSLVYRIIRKDESIRYVESLGEVVKTDKGEGLKMFGTFQDITETKIAENKIIQSEYYYRVLIENSADAVSILDKNGIIKYESPSHKRILGYATNELSGTTSFSLVHPEDVEDIKARFLQLAQKPEAMEEVSFRYKHKNGTWRNLEGTAKNLLHNPGIEGIIVNYRDVTDRVKFEDELVKAKEKAEESDRLKTAFLSNMSHEIRTPMNGILGFLDLLGDPNLTESSQKEFREIIKKSGRRLMDTINDIIELSKIEAGETPEKFSDININDTLEYMHRFFLPETQSKKLEFKIGGSGQKIAARTDNNKLESVLTNLIKNAIKFTSEGTIEIGVETAGKKLLFFVRDTGKGIPSEKLEAIFGRFVQADLHHSRGYEGSGLGLSICKAYVDMLGGEIWAESEAGRGSTFYFTIGYQPVAKEEPEQKESDPLKIRNQSGVKNIVVLVAEDDTVSYALFQSYLSKSNYTLLLAETGAETVSMVKNNPEIDIVLMDIKMPGMDGIEATREIRKFNTEIPVIAQTAYALPEEREKALEAGCNAYLAKPIRKDELVNLINQMPGC